jgi:AcrR family transcriptional regulator
MWHNRKMAINTAAEILEATQELLLAKGEAKTTLRAVTERANANVAAVNYHFGSRDQLIRQAYLSALTEVTMSQGARLQALPADADLEAFVNVWLGPVLNPESVSKRERELWALLQKGSVENAPQLQELMPSMQEMEVSPLIAMLATKLPHLEQSEIVFRHNAVMLGLGGLLRGAVESAADSHDQRAFVLRWVLASLQG